jgi:hypothetical protein
LPVDVPACPETLRANAAPKSRRGFAAQTAEHPRQVFLMGEAERQSDLSNRVVGPQPSFPKECR